MADRQAGVNVSRAAHTAGVLVAEISFLELIQKKERMYESLRALGLLVSSINREMNQGVTMTYKSHLQVQPSSCIAT